MSIKASPEVIEELEREINTVVTNIAGIKSDIKSGIDGLNSGWNDSKADEFKDIMKELINLMNGPEETLKETLPKLKKLKGALDSYNNVKF